MFFFFGSSIYHKSSFSEQKKKKKEKPNNWLTHMPDRFHFYNYDHRTDFPGKLLYSRNFQVCSLPHLMQNSFCICASRLKLTHICACPACYTFLLQYGGDVGHPRNQYGYVTCLDAFLGVLSSLLLSCVLNWKQRRIGQKRRKAQQGWQRQWGKWPQADSSGAKLLQSWLLLTSL